MKENDKNYNIAVILIISPAHPPNFVTNVILKKVIFNFKTIRAMRKSLGEQILTLPNDFTQFGPSYNNNYCH